MYLIYLANSQHILVQDEGYLHTDRKWLATVFNNNIHY